MCVFGEKTLCVFLNKPKLLYLFFFRYKHSLRNRRLNSQSALWVRNMCWRLYVFVEENESSVNVFSCFVQGQTHWALCVCGCPGQSVKHTSLTAWHTTAAIRASSASLTLCYHDNDKQSALQLLGKVCKKSLGFWSKLGFINHKKKKKVLDRSLFRAHHKACDLLNTNRYACHYQSLCVCLWD